MNIDGTNSLACLKPIEDIKGVVRISPLPHTSVVKDLVPDLTQFYSQYAFDRAVAQGSVRRLPIRKDFSQRKIRKKSTSHRLASFVHVVRHPARATGGTRIDILVRQRCCRPIAGWSTAATRRRAERLGQLEGSFKLYRCHTILNCTQACPKDLNPGKAIARIKQLMLER